MSETKPPINFEYKLVSFENLSRFTELVHACFKIDVNEDYFRWKYCQNPVGKLVAFEALDKDRVAAFYGLIPELYNINGQVTKIYQSMDTMTHPDYQKRGLFVKLANLTFDYVKNTEGRLDMVGIPGTNSFHGFVHKLNWKNIHNFKFFFLPKAWHQFKYFFRKTSSVEFKLITNQTPNLQHFFSSVRSLKPISNSFTLEFFSWRVFQHPYRNYKTLELYEKGKFVGLCVYAIDSQKRCYLYYLNFLDQDLFFTLSSDVFHYLFQATKASFIYTWEPLDTTIGRAFRSIGFLKNPFHRGPFSYPVPLITRSEADKVNGVDWFNIANFDIQPLMQD